MKFIGIIPARYASTRFPGKPLAKIGGITMIERVCRQAAKALDRVVVATDDERIFDAVKAFGGEVVMTSDSHRSGTDRCYEAYCNCGSDADVVINIQGDEPFIDPLQIETLKSCFERPATRIATLVRRFNPADGFEALSNPNTPKVVIDSEGRAMYFSRSVIPYVRGKEHDRWPEATPYFTHVGIYAFRADTLAEVVNLPQSSLELAESLEQLRWLQAGYQIQTALTDSPTIGIDTPDDLARAEKHLLSSGPDRSTPPPVVEFSNIEMQPLLSEVLDNGVELNYLNCGDQDICRIDIMRLGGRMEFTADSASLMVMAECMRELTADYSSEQIADIIDFNGARLGSRVADHFTMLSLVTLESRASQLLPLLESILTRARFDTRTVDTAARRLAAAAATRQAQVMSQASMRAIAGAVGSENPAAKVVTPEEYAAVTVADVEKCYQQWLHDSAYVFMAGRLSPATLDAVRDMAGRMPAATKTEMSITPYSPDAPARIEIPMPDAVQAAVSISLPTIGREHPDYIPLRLAVIALGGYFGSRLMTNIREEKGLTYGISASLLGCREGAFMQIDAQCDAAFVDQVIDETQAEIRRLIAEPPTGDELSRLRMYAWSVLASNTDSPLGMLDFYATRLIVGTPADYFERQLHCIATLTPETIARMAERYLTGRPTIAIAAPGVA